MPFNVLNKNYEIELPVRGVDLSTVRAKPIPQTCPDIRNMRTWDLRDRAGLGKRSGSIKAFTDRAGQADGRQITSLSPMRLGTAPGSEGASYSETITDDFSGYAAADPADLLGNYVFIQRGTGVATNAFPTDFPRTTGAPQYLQFDGNTNSTMAVVNYLTNNDVTGTMTGHTDSGTIANYAINYRIMVRGSDDLTDFIQCGLVDTGVNLWAIRFVRQQGSSLTTLGTSTDFAITEGDATESNFILRVVANGTELRAELTWTAKAITFSYTLANTDFAANRRAGIGLQSNIGRTGQVKQFVYTRYVPVNRPLVRRLLGTDTETPLTGYILPSGWTSIALTTAGALTTAIGPADEAAAQAYPLIRDNTDVIVVSSGNAGGTARTNFVTPTTGPADGQNLAVELRYRIASTNIDDESVVFRISDDFRNSMKVILTRNNNSTASSAGQVAFFSTGTAWQLRFCVNGTLTGTLGGEINTPLHGTSYTRWEDTGTILRAVHNGMVVVEIPYTTDGAWAAAQASLTGSRVGMEMPEVDSGGAGGFGFKIVDNANTITSVSQFTDRVLILSKGGLVQSGRVDDASTINTLAGFGSDQQLPSVFDFAQKWYMVDGTNNKIIDPNLGTSEEWADMVTDGDLPLGCRLACLYRGRAVLARQDDNPTIYYMSRVFDPLDWDFGASPVTTSAVAGTNANVGRPGDVIVALITYSDDYLLFGCAASLWMMEGDPGYDGAVQAISLKTGIVGPRAWCFNEQGDLFFIGAGGLYKMARGTRDPILISDRIEGFLNRQDLDATLIQLAYDANKGTVHMFNTNLALTGSVHAIYDTRRDAFFFDELPINSDPFSVCEITGSADEDRRILWGCNDGFIRRWSDTTYSDHDSSFTEGADTANEEETAIRLFVRFSPVENNDAFRDMMLTALQFQGDSENGETDWYLLVGDSAEEVGDKELTLGNAFRSGTIFGSTPGFSGGHQQIIRVRARAGVQQLALIQESATDILNMERVVVMFSPFGKRR